MIPVATGCVTEPQGRKQAAVAEWLAHRMGADDVRISAWSQLSGGAIQSNIALDAEVTGGGFSGSHRLVLRTDAATAVAASLDRAREFAVLRMAWDAGVRAPEPLFLCEDQTILGSKFFVMRRLPGVAAGRRVVRDAAIVPDRDALAFELGENLARIHAIGWPQAGLGAIDAPSGDHARAVIAEYRGFLDVMDDAHPAIEWGLRWCELHAPAAGRTTLIHRDYRTGNYLVDHGHLAGILDWEFAGWGDPREDIGWFSARCWRFGAFDHEAGGLTSIEPFLRGYVAGGGTAPSRDELIWWQVIAHLRWAVIALQQSRRHLIGGERSLELALTGRIVHELEYEAVHLTALPMRGSLTDPAPTTRVGAAADIADASDLLASAGETLEDDVLPAVPSELRYPSLMVARAMAIALREQRLGPASAAAEAARLAALVDDAGIAGVASAASVPAARDRHAERRALARAIRAGAFDSGPRHDALVAHLAETVRQDVAISNPAALSEAT